MELKKDYQLWVNYGYDGWSLTEYDTIEEALKAETYGSDWVITKRVDYEVKEKD